MGARAAAAAGAGGGTNRSCLIIGEASFALSHALWCLLRRARLCAEDEDDEGDEDNEEPDSVGAEGRSEAVAAQAAAADDGDDDVDVPLPASLLLPPRGRAGPASQQPAGVCARWRLVATSLDTRTRCEEVFGAAARRALRPLSRARSVTLAHGVDATRLRETLPGGLPMFAAVVFAFPCVAQRNAIGQNRALLDGFFASVGDVLAADGVVCVVLSRGQGGTPADGAHRRAAANHWQAAETASSRGFVLVDARRFDCAWWAAHGYVPTGRRAYSASFQGADGAVAHVFARRAPHGAHAFFAPAFERHICFEPADPADGARIMAACLDPRTVASVELLNVYPPRRALTFRVVFQAQAEEPLGPVAELVRTVGERLAVHGMRMRQ